MIITFFSAAQKTDTMVKGRGVKRRGNTKDVKNDDKMVPATPKANKTFEKVISPRGFGVGLFFFLFRCNVKKFCNETQI